MKSQKKYHLKSIKASIKDGDDTKVKVEFHGGAFTPEEFTSLIMAFLETYTLGLLETNTPEAIFEHFNNVFGIYLNRLVPAKEHYKLSPEHKEFKDLVNATLDRKETAEDRKETEENRLAAYLLARDILVTELGMTEESADVILNKRLKMAEYEKEEKE